MSTIMEIADIADIEGLDVDETSDFADLTATTGADRTTMDFHVQMRGYTMRDFESMVVHAAAQQLVGGRTFSKEIKEEAAAIASAKVTDQLSFALKDVMSLTVMKRGSEDVSLREMIGMEAKTYLTEIVGSDGKPVTDSWGRRDGVPRVQHLAAVYLRDAFKKEIEQAFKDIREELKSAISGKIESAIAEERKKIADALGHEIKKMR